jgi:hypothetical protein
MTNSYTFNVDEIDVIYEYLHVAQDVSNNMDEVFFIREIMKKIDEQSEYNRPEVIDYKVHIPNTDYVDFVYGTDRENAVIRWTEEYLNLEVTEQSRPHML